MHTGTLLGLVHDCGKFKNEFQEYLLDTRGVRGSVNHTFAGTRLLLGRYHGSDDGMRKLAAEFTVSCRVHRIKKLRGRSKLPYLFFVAHNLLDRRNNDLQPGIIQENGAGETITLYGGIVERSVGYIAYQNRNSFRNDTEAVAIERNSVLRNPQYAVFRRWCLAEKLQNQQEKCETFVNNHNLQICVKCSIIPPQY